MTPLWSWDTAALAGAGVLCGAGLACAAYGASLVNWRETAAAPRLRRWSAFVRQRRLWVCAAGAAGAATAVVLITGWPVAGVLAAAAGWWMPALLGPDTTTRTEADLAEALASWAEQLRDMITGASGLHQAIAATAPLAPARIRDQVHTLQARLRAGQPMERAAGAFAHEVDCDLGDLIALTLTTGASPQSAADVAGALSRLAEAARERATTVARVSASRVRVRSAVRIIAAATALMLLGMALFNPAFLQPLGTWAGQSVLALTGGLWAASFWWLARLAAPPKPPRPFRPAPQESVLVEGGAR
ncbi:type II secretion system F family protein [Nocardiopsis sp. LOL_012]|uniref:type II secretion system F family protein n=1 Tax=Nocardiopsis sp. LOL_012 TaxID=3345409 RepID=UPI003A85683D